MRTINEQLLFSKNIGEIVIIGMNQLQELFKYKEVELRVVIKSGEPWWVAKDVCEILDVKNISDATKRLDEDEKGIDTVDTLGGIQEMLLVNESGLYSIILTSRKEEAKAFKRWITHDVIPSIRRTGKYITEKEQPKTPAEILLMNAQMLVEYERKMKIVEEKQIALESKQDKMISYLVEIPDREGVNNKIKELARMKYIKNQQDARNDAYLIFKNKYGIDIMSRVKNRKDDMNKERMKNGKNPYSDSTLSTKVSGMDIIEELGMLKELNEIVIGLLTDDRKSLVG